MKRNLTALLTVLLLLLTVNVFAAGKIPSGYETLAWGVTFHEVMQKYPKGRLAEYNKEMVYLQENPDSTIASRLFAFKDGQLTAVSITYNKQYVTDTGVENIKKNLIAKYGKGKDAYKSKSAHMVSYYWEGKKTRLSFVTVPNRPEMTVLQVEKQ